jgi:hypothetical protein
MTRLNRRRPRYEDSGRCRATVADAIVFLLGFFSRAMVAGIPIYCRGREGGKFVGAIAVAGAPSDGASWDGAPYDGASA